MAGWIWALIILGIIAFGVLIYILLTKDSSGSPVFGNLGGNGAFSPPALPD